uniref:Uncharacterized protein n=1 Tax=Anguilla anguilla TaxID=7936 RepID=A0A0E9UMQ9_ANGAN
MIQDQRFSSFISFFLCGVKGIKSVLC